MSTINELSPEQNSELIKTLQTRFEANKDRHKELHWNKILTKLEINPQKLWSLHAMENTRGEPDVIAYDTKTDEYIFYDFSPESPKGRRSICYDPGALEIKKKTQTKTQCQRHGP